MVLLAVISLCFAFYFVIKHISPKTAVAPQAPTTSISPVQTQTPNQTNLSPTEITLCQPNQLVGKSTAQGAAGNIYVNLELTNTGKTACDVELGNQVIATFDGKYIVPPNITIHNMQQEVPESVSLPPGAKLYSQVHYPNGPQCQSGIKPIAIAFLIDQSTVSFDPDSQSGKLMVQACKSDSEKTVIDFWPLSKTPINP